jgi:hypothetical protein
VFVAHCSWVALRDRYRIPFSDDWRILNDLYSSPTVWQWLFTEQNSHFLPGTLLLAYLDFAWLGGHMGLLVAGSLVCAGLVVLALLAALRADGGWNAPLPRASAALAVFLLFWSHAYYAFPWGMMQGNLLALLGLCAALACIASYVAAPAAERAARLLWGAGVGAFVATFSHGAGFSVWLGLVFVVLVARLPFRVGAAFAGGAVLTAALFLIGDGARPSGDSATLVGRATRTIEYAATLSGSVPGKILWHAGLVPLDVRTSASFAAGLAGWLVAALLTAKVLRRRDPHAPRGLVALGFMATGAAAGALVGSVRAGQLGLVTATAERYVNWSGVFWAGAALALPVLLGRRAARGAPAAVAIALLAALSALLWGQLAAQRETHERRREMLWSNSVFLMLDLPHDSLARKMFPLGRLEDVYQLAGHLRRDRTSFFAARAAGLPGEPLARHFDRAPPERCQGELQLLKTLDLPRGTAALVEGVARDNAGGELRFVAVVDEEDVVRGLGSFAPSQADPWAAPPGAGSQPLRWRGAIGGFDPARRYTAYGILGDGRRACRLGSARER